MIQSSGICFVVNQHFRIDHWNEAMARFMGISADDAQGQSCLNVVSAQSVQGLNFCRMPCPLVSQNHEQELEHPLTIVIPTRFTGHQLIQFHFALWDDPLTIVHWIHPLNRNFIPTNPLTPRQHQIFSLLSQGLTQTEIAQRLNIAPSTVDTHIRRVCDMWDVPTKKQALTHFIRMQSVAKPSSNGDPGSNTT